MSGDKTVMNDFRQNVEVQSMPCKRPAMYICNVL